ncbi:RsmD family RNA methyltransferase [Nakamurella lactea]|uniref:RsmD family RNA methyltransferase n=1 Tax=Nakamurella lactea TaxID=459515 RepID=UPI0004288C1B|nr:RsmD family RNA methyltransferase [Nakamurella lactea]
MTRIVAGHWKGRTLRTPSGGTTRPTAEKIRAALGNALQAAGALDGATVLDLYAGSGALGLELLSRGAASLVSVEKDRRALEALRANVAGLTEGTSGRQAAAAPGVPVEVLGADVQAALPRLAGRSFDLVVADPPYDLPAAELHAVLAALGPLLAPGAEVVVERSARSGEPDWPAPLIAVRAKRYGDTLLCYGRAQ